MSIFSSLYVGMSGMRVNGDAMAIIGDNISNMNTIGYKGSRAGFADVINRTVIGSAGSQQVGQGATVQAVQRMHSQGALLGTAVATDLAIGGNGYFLVKGNGAALQSSTGFGSGLFYTRNGQFEIDHEGYLANLSGLRVQGYPADNTGQLQATVDDLEIVTQTSPPNATTQVAMVTNLDSTEDIIAAAIDSADPATYNFATAVTIYDSLGDAHQVDVYFQKTADSQWSWQAEVSGEEVAGGVAGDPPVTIATGNLGFTADGVLDTEASAPAGVQFAGGAAVQTIDWDFGESLTTDAGDGTGSSGYASQSNVSFLNQDGFGSGEFRFFTVHTDGTIEGFFSNGESRTIGKLALASFTAPNQLMVLGDNLYAETRESGEPIVGVPDTGGRGQIFSGSLEQSNVELANEFTQMIITQRGFQASSRTITTADTMLTELVNLKR